jgi:hypothetical protein
VEGSGWPLLSLGCARGWPGLAEVSGWIFCFLGRLVLAVLLVVVVGARRVARVSSRSTVGGACAAVGAVWTLLAEEAVITLGLLDDYWDTARCGVTETGVFESHVDPAG